MKNGLVFLVPTYLSESNDSKFLAPMVLEVVKNTGYFLVENIRTARRFVSSLGLGLDISALKFEVVDKKSSPEAVAALMALVIQGSDVGVISEAGLPGLADPGSMVVAWAHKNNIRVVPLPGATSIQTAVISSGFSGQQFTFHGYLPIPKTERIKAIRNMESTLFSTGYTQLFMETPFRNMSLLDDLLGTLHPDTWLHIASDLFGEGELVKTRKVKNWKTSKPDIHKVPAVFCIGQFS